MPSQLEAVERSKDYQEFTRLNPGNEFIKDIKAELKAAVQSLDTVKQHMNNKDLANAIRTAAQKDFDKAVQW